MDKNKFKNQKLDIPDLNEIFNNDLQKLLKSYDNIFLNHIKYHYYDGQIPIDILEKIKIQLNENKNKIFN